MHGLDKKKVREKKGEEGRRRKDRIMKGRVQYELDTFTKDKMKMRNIQSRTSK